MTDNWHKKRIESLIRKELGATLLRYPKDRIFVGVTITAVDVSPDLAVAKIFFSLFDNIFIEDAIHVLQREDRFLRKILAKSLNLRITPKLIFVHDDSIRKSQELMKLINSVVAADEEVLS